MYICLRSTWIYFLVWFSNCYLVHVEWNHFPQYKQFSNRRNSDHLQIHHQLAVQFAPATHQQFLPWLKFHHSWFYWSYHSNIIIYVTRTPPCWGATKMLPLTSLVRTHLSQPPLVSWGLVTSQVYWLVQGWQLFFSPTLWTPVGISHHQQKFSAE